ncbi:hypothetical protein TeGR_g10686, partial [Tetraparma gracilis]
VLFICLPRPGATGAPGAVTEAGGLPGDGGRKLEEVCYTANLFDSYGDGWNGNMLTITDSDTGATVKSLTQSGSTAANTAESFSVCFDSVPAGASLCDAVLSAERAAVVAVLSNVPGWSDDGGDHCSWSGITCGSDGRVTEIYQYDVGMTSIAPEIGQLTSLTDLFLRDNQITSIPAEIGQLTSLTVLSLNYNQITGGIPAEIGQLTSLTYLNLEVNQITGGIPAEIGQLTSLTELDLDNNQINGTIPAELSALTNLQVLVLSNNDFVPPVPASVQEMCRQSVSCAFGGNQGLHACGKGYADTSDGTCENNFVNTDTSIMCATCPVSSFPVTGSCMDCPSNPVLSFLLPLGALFSIILLGLIVYKLQKHDLIRLPELNLDLTTMIRIKQLTAVLQVLSVFAALSAVLAPWFLAITDFLSAIAAPVEIQPVCSSYYEKLMNSNYDFLRAWVAFGSMYLCAFVLRRAHKLSFMRSRVSIGTFDKMQKLAALIIIQAPLVVLPLSANPDRLLELTGYGKNLRNAQNLGPLIMTFVSLSLLVFLLHRSIKSSSAQYKTLRAELLEQFASSSDNSDVEELTWDDINKSRPFIAAFCMQYTPAEYQHEEKVVWRKIMWVVGTTITQTCSLVVMAFGNSNNSYINKTKIPGVTTAVLKSIFICVNIGYSRHLLRRPYTSHRMSAQMGDPMNDCELLLTRVTCWAAALLTLRESLLEGVGWPGWSMDLFCAAVVAGVVASQLPLFHGVVDDVRESLSRILSRSASSDLSGRSRGHSGARDLGSGGQIQTM